MIKQHRISTGIPPIISRENRINSFISTKFKNIFTTQTS